MTASNDRFYPKALPESTRTVIAAAAQAEHIAAEIVDNKRLLVALDRKRHATMEALAAFRVKANGASAVPASSKPWTCFGPTFIKLPAPYVQSMLQQDRARLDAEIETTRSIIKKLILSMQNFRPSEMDPRLVEFAMREAKRAAEGNEMEFDEGDDEEDIDGDH